MLVALTIMLIFVQGKVQAIWKDSVFADVTVTVAENTTQSKGSTGILSTGGRGILQANCPRGWGGGAILQAYCPHGELFLSTITAGSGTISFHFHQMLV